MSGACSADMALVDRFRFFGKPEEVSFNSHTAGRILWVPCELHRNETFSTEEKLLRSELEAEMLMKSDPLVKMLASFLGFCQSTLAAIAVAPLHFIILQAGMIKGLKGSRGDKATGVWSVSLQKPRKNWNGGGTT